MLGVYLTSLAVVAVSLVLGAGAMRISGYRRPSWASAALGNAILIVLSSVAMRLPGAVGTTLVLVAIALAVAAFVLRAERPAPRLALEGLPVTVIVLLLLGLPFFVFGHFGLLGVSLDNDLGFHVGWVEQFHSGHAPFGLGPHGYPTGLEALAAVSGGSLQSATRALVGVGVAAPVLTALTALTVLGRALPGLRILGAAAIGLPYLSAAYFGESSFKEVEMALLVLGFALLSVRAPEHGGWWPRGFAPLLVLTAAMYLTLGPGGFVYAGVIVVARLLVGLARTRVPHLTRRGRWRALAGASAACLLVVGFVLVARQHAGLIPFAFSQLHHSQPGGNLVRALPLTEGLGVWLGRNFALPSDSTPVGGLLVVLAIVVEAGGALVALRARDFTVVVPAIAVLAVVLISSALVIPYDVAKAMVIAGPLLVAAGIVPLCQYRPRTRRGGALIAPAIAAAFALAVLWTGAYALRSSPVNADAYDKQLATMRGVLAGRTVLFLGHDDWLPADLPRARVETAFTYYELPLPGWPRPEKGLRPPLDFDSLPSAALDRVQFVISTRSLAASSAPANFSPLMRTRDFILWARHGPTARREVLAEGSNPGAVLACRTLAGRRLARRSGVAAVRPAPVISGGWRTPFGASPPTISTYAVTPPAGHVSTTLPLSPGRWQLSLDYQGPDIVTLRVGATRFTLPTQLEPPGTLWAVGVIDVRRSPVTVDLQADSGPAPLPIPWTLAGPIHAVPARPSVQLVPLRSACGRYVDWYSLRG